MIKKMNAAGRGMFVRYASCCIGLLPLLALPSAPVMAQNYPDHPIRFIYPFTSGSLSETSWRLINQEASKRLGQPIIVNNRPGAGGRIGTTEIKNAAPDGYTIGAVTPSTAVVASLADPGFSMDPVKDYTPVMPIFSFPLVLVSSAALPFRDVRGLIAYAKANPGKLNGASSGVGSLQHLSLELFKSMAKVDIVHVPFQGDAPAVQAVLSNAVQIFFNSGSARSFIDSGRIIGLATGATERWTLFPTLPTFREAGLPGFLSTSWHGLAAPSRVPGPVLEQIAAAYNAALKAPEIRAKLEADGTVIVGGNQADMVAVIKGDFERYGPIVKATAMKTTK